jgi:tetratricopeptide (TPR) repeat protein
MEFVAAKCPNCAGELRLPEDMKRAKCMYCGFDVIVREAINAAGASVENWLKLASTAEETGNHAEAYKYFTQVLEYEPDNYIAQLGKGITAGYLSTPYKFRAEELIKGVESAIENAPESKKQEIKLQAAEKICAVCKEFEVDNESDESNSQRRIVIVCLNLAHEYAPENSQILTSLYFQYCFLAINSKKLNLRYQTNDYDSYVAEANQRAEECLSKLQAVNPEQAASLRKTEVEASIFLLKPKKEAEIKLRQTELKRTNKLAFIAIVAILIISYVLAPLGIRFEGSFIFLSGLAFVIIILEKNGYVKLPF